MRSPARWVIGIVFSLVLTFTSLLSVGVQTASAQTQTQTQTQTASPLNYLQPNVEGNVPLNQHTFLQSTFIESLSAFGCVLVGIDIVGPNQQCLSINWQTNQLGYAPTNTISQGVQLGGLLGVANKGISFVYTPVTSSTEYAQYVASNFGIVKPVEAAPLDGFTALKPLLAMWTAVRNIAYFLLTIAFVFIGLGVMLRIKIDPRTVMTVQNRIPDIIICILLITFSYAIPAVMVDTMWVATYAGMNIITAATDPDIPGCSDSGGTDKDLNKLSKQATNQILSSPFSFVDAVFLEQCEEKYLVPDIHSGILDLSKDVANNFVDLERGIILSVLGVNENEECSFTNAVDCGLKILFKFASWFADIAWWLIVVIAIVVSVFRLLFALLKAYLSFIVYTITGPVFIVMGLLPKKPLGFNAWFRRLVANLAVFSTTVWAIVFLRVLDELYKVNAADTFVPPLVGNPNVSNFGAIIVLGGLLMLPHTLDLIRDKMGAKPSNLAAAAGAGIAVGAAAAGTVPKKGMAKLNKRDQHGAALGPLARLKDDKQTQAMMWAGNKFGSKLPWLKTAAERSQHIKEHGNLRGFQAGAEGRAFDARIANATAQGASVHAPEAGMRYVAGAQGARRYKIDEQIADLKAQKEHGNLSNWTKKRVDTKIRKLNEEKGRMGTAGIEPIPQKPTAPPPPPAGGERQPATGGPGEAMHKGESPQLPELRVDTLIADNIRLSNGEDVPGMKSGETTHQYLEKIMQPGSAGAHVDESVIPNITPDSGSMTPQHVEALKKHITEHYEDVKEDIKTKPPTDET
jgi:hypothetical protein